MARINPLSTGLLFGIFLMAMAGCDAATVLKPNPIESQPGMSEHSPTNASCPLENLTSDCRCENQQWGVQTCIAGIWTDCQCEESGIETFQGDGIGFAPDSGIWTTNLVNTYATLSQDVNPEDNYASVRFDWKRTMPQGGSCEPGHYEGTFSGLYGPSAMVVSLPVIPVFPLTLPGIPGLAFDLHREGNGEIYRVSNGEMNGNALAFVTFHSDIEGSLNCETGRFEAMMTNGVYNTGSSDYYFEGPLVADYDKFTHSMISGIWSVVEPDYPIAGGSGTWTATWFK